MKKLILLKLLTLPFLLCSQVNSNLLSKSDFSEIRINNVSFLELKETYGDQSKLMALFIQDIQRSDIDPDGEFYNYEYDGFRIGFSGLIGSLEYPIISKFEITNSNWRVTIKGKTVNLGSHYNELGNVILNNRTDGGKSVVFQYCDGCNNYLAFELDGNGKIKKIYYIEMT